MLLVDIIFSFCWLLQVPLVSVLSLSVCPMSVYVKVLPNFNITRSYLLALLFTFVDYEIFPLK